jgi:hypothetical protein
MSVSTLLAIVLALLQFANRLMESISREEMRNEGRVLEINRSLASIARMTTDAREIEQAVSDMSDDDVADELSRLAVDDTATGNKHKV